MQENELIQRLQEGKEDAFEFIFRKYFVKLCLFAEHMLKDSSAAEEIVEDFFCYLWENCKDINKITNLNGYMFRSIHNRCLKYIRHLNVKKKYGEYHQYIYSDKEILEPDYTSYPPFNLSSKELEDKIYAAIEELPDKCKTIFCLNRFENRTYNEIAKDLNISVNTVKTQMARALNKLRESMKDFLPFIAFLFFTIKNL